MEPEDKTMKVAEGAAQAIDSQDKNVTLDTTNTNPAPATDQPSAAAPPTPAPTPTPDTAQPTPPTEPAEAAPVAEATDQKPTTPSKPKLSKSVIFIVAAVVVFLLGLGLVLFGYLIYGIVTIILAAILVLLGVFLPPAKPAAPTQG